MHYKVYENAFDLEIIKGIFNYYTEYKNIHSTNGIYKIEHPWNIDIIQNTIKPILSQYIDTNLPNIGDNIYKHNYPYYPHVDLSGASYPCINVLIPIKVHNNVEQKFCIFDQHTTDFSTGATWVGNHYDIIKDFEHNKKRKFIHNDDTIKNKTGYDIDENFYINNIDHIDRDREMFKSLSGVAVDFKPGNLIVFDSKYIHCTGKMTCDWKIGLSLRFLGKFNKEICESVTSDSNLKV